MNHGGQPPRRANPIDGWLPETRLGRIHPRRRLHLAWPLEI
jgi:hypothetical protein